MVQRENKNIFLMVLWCLWFLLVFAIVLQQGQQLNQMQEEIAELQNKQTNISIEMKETEQKCQRMTDTCIDILTNTKW